MPGYIIESIIMNTNTLKKEIKELKEKKNAVILAHNYQIDEVQLIADYLGDSLELSKIASETKNPLIVFAGVKFMAETAKILSPEKTVLLPRLDAGCPMADMITLAELNDLKKEYPDAKVVTYVNSTAEIKANSDVCCTSANAVKIVKNIDSKKVIFIPDRNLGSYVQSQVPEKEIILFEGYCYVHNRIKEQEIEKMKQEYPDAEILVHPEVRKELIPYAHKVLSTSGMLRYAKESKSKVFIVATEQGLLNRMKRENPDKEFLPAIKPKYCSNMKKTTLIDVLNSLTNNQYEIKIEKEIIKKAKNSLEKMLNYI